MMKIFDTHCHLACDELRPELHNIAIRAKAEGVMGLAIIAADEKSLHGAFEVKKELSAMMPDMKIVATSGVHPHDSSKIDEKLWQYIENYAEEAAGIGETGLDYHYMNSEKKTQIELFERHIDLACRLQKPLIIHCREAAEDILNILSNSKGLQSHPRPGILHCFTENKEVAFKLIDLGFVISFSGIMTFRNAQSLRDIAAEIPLESLLIETDSPWLAPIPMRGKQNEPAFVRHVYNELCRIRIEKAEKIAESLWSNSLHIFAINENN